MTHVLSTYFARKVAKSDEAIKAIDELTRGLLRMGVRVDRQLVVDRARHVRIRTRRLRWATYWGNR